MSIIERLATAAGLYKFKKLKGIGATLKEELACHEINILGLIRGEHIKDFRRSYNNIKKSKAVYEIQFEEDVLNCIDILDYGHYNKCYAYLANCEFDGFDLYELVAGSHKLKA